MAIDLTLDIHSIAIGVRDTTTITKPDGVVEGDFLLAVVKAGAANVTWTPPAGWTEITQAYSTDDCWIGYKRAGGAEPADYTWEHDDGKSTTGLIWRMTGVVASGSPQNCTLAAVARSGSSFKWNGITTVNSGCAVIAIGIVANAAATIASNYTTTTRSDLATTPGIFVGGDIQPIAGGTAWKYLTVAGGATTCYCVLLALTPASAPSVSISSVSGSTADGGSLVISGSGFGVGATAVHFMGGSGGNIDSGTSGNVISDASANWITLPSDVDGSRKARYSNAKTRGRNNSVLCPLTYEAGHSCMSSIGWDSKSSFTSRYLSFWVNLNFTDLLKGDASYQWKIFRIAADDSSLVDTSLGGGAAVFSYWNGTNIPAATSSFYAQSDSANATVEAYLGTTMGDCAPGTDEPRQGQWVRYECWHKQASGDYPVTDGELYIWYHPQNAVVDPVLAKYGNYPTHSVADGDTKTAWRYLAVGNAMTSMAPATDGIVANVYLDDLYTADSPARVEIGDNATWANCKHLEIQKPTAWAAGEITVTLNQGSFAVGDTAYVFVVDSNGNVSSGYEFEFLAEVSGGKKRKRFRGFGI